MSRGGVLLTVPDLQGQGGVASFYNGVLSHFPHAKVTPLEIGGCKNTGGLLHPLIDQVRFRNTLKDLRPELIHLNPSLGFKSFLRDGLFAWQAKKLGIPFVVFWHGWDKMFESKVAGKYRGFFNSSFGCADGFIVLASEFEKTLRGWGVTVPVYKATTNVEESLLSGVDAQAKWADPSQLSQIKVLFLARLERAKGAFETVQAVKSLIDKQLSVSLTVAGDGDIRHELEGFTRSLGLTSEQVNFTGHIQGADKIRAFAEHQIYCFPTFYGEGLPTSVLEAMAFGMPVVTRPVGGLADIFEDGKMGALVHGKSPEEIAGCLEKIITNPVQMAETGRYNAAYAKEHFMASVVAGKLVAIYDSILAKNT